jgi:hypothetical protein
MFMAKSAIMAEKTHLQRREQGPRPLVAQDVRGVVAGLGPGFLGQERG